MPRGLEIKSIVYSYQYISFSCFLEGFFLHMVLSKWYYNQNTEFEYPQRETIIHSVYIHIHARWQDLEALYIKINKPSLNKINFKCGSHILKCIQHFFHQFFLPPVNFSFVNSPLTCFFSNSLSKCILLDIVLVISLFFPVKMAPDGAESTWEKYGAFFNLFHPDYSHKDFNRSVIK